MAKNEFKYYTAYDTPPEVPCSPGRDLVPNYREVKENGKPGRLEHIGDSSMDDQIQSFASSVSLSEKIARFECGDTNALMTNGGFYADLTHAPTSLAEAIKININLAEAYDSLPGEIREIFGDFDEFKKSAFNKSFDAKVAQYMQKVAASQEKSEVQTNEVKEG